MALPTVYRFFVDYERGVAYRTFDGSIAWANPNFIQGDGAKCEFYLVKSTGVAGIPWEAVDFDGSATYSLKLGTVSAVATSSTTASSTSATAATVTTVVGGSASANEIQQISLSPIPAGGTFTVEYGGNYTAAIDVEATAAELKTALNAIAALTDKTNVYKVADYVWRIEFIGTLAKTNVNAVTVQIDGVRTLSGKAMTLDMSAAGVGTLLNGAATATATLEFSYTVSGETQTGFQMGCTVLNDL